MNRLPPAVAWSDVTAIFGGRFDPPHLGHREAVRGLFKYPRVKEVLIIPSATPPHKPAAASAEHRAKMAALNFGFSSSDPTFPAEVRMDFREIARAQRDPLRPSYSFDTLQELKPIFSQLAFVIGMDQLYELPRWHRFPEILTLCHWLILERKPFHFQNEKAAQVLKDWNSSGIIQSLTETRWKITNGSTQLMLIPTDAPDISSTHTREQIAKTGQAAPEALLPEVVTYLKKNKLYGI